VLGAERPLFGHGLETFTAEYARVRSEDLARRYPDQIEESPHNIFLDAWVTQGLLGVAALAGLCWAGLVGVRRAPLESAAFAAALAANQFLAFTAMTEAVFLFCGALAAAARRPPLQEGLRVGWLLRVPGLLTALLLGAAALQALSADYWAERSRRLLLAGRAAEAIEAWRRAESSSPPGRSYGEWFARALYGSAAFSSEWTETALDALLTPRSESPADAHYLEAALLAQAGRPALEIERALRASVEASPVWYKPRWKLAQVLQATGRNEEALAWAESSDKLAGGASSEVRQTLDALRAP
jgi:tetratricopeptide (TPR) repeat protein